MKRDELLLLLPSSGKDIVGAERLLCLGYPALAPVVPEMIRFLRIYKSPVASLFCQFFVENQDVLCSRLGTLLAKAREPCVRYVLLTEVMARWRPENIRAIHDRLCSVAATMTYDFHQTDLIALGMLIEHGLSIEQFRGNWLESSERWLAERAERLAALRAAEFPGRET